MAADGRTKSPTKVSFSTKSILFGKGMIAIPTVYSQNLRGQPFPLVKTFLFIYLRSRGPGMVFGICSS